MGSFRWWMALLAMGALLALGACDSDDGDDGGGADIVAGDDTTGGGEDTTGGGDDTVAPTCEPACDADACEACVDGLCESTCTEGQVCDAGTCVDETPTCEPACDADACEACVDGACASTCTEGQVCDAGTCVDETPTCEPACDADACEACIDGACASTCTEGQVCDAGTCVDETPTCEPACDADACEACVDGACESTCDLGETCEDGTCQPLPVDCDPPCEAGEACVNSVCIPEGAHTNLPQLDGPFEDGPAVTAACLGCHDDAANEFITTSHWLWRGATPGMAGHETGDEIGKVNTINNFCIAIDSNEPRCTQCHAGYGWKDKDFDFADKGKIDCLVCHDGSGTYAKAKKTAGGVEEGVDLVVVAKSIVREPTRKACGSCHFKAGGGDNVKKGDIGSWAVNPAPEADVHMGNGMTCAGCHAAEGHKLSGSGLHNPVQEAELACTTCHQGPVIHEGNATVEAHLDHIACQTCHIPAFSRQQPTKMDWKWEFAGDQDREPVLDENGMPDYDPMKGEFVWGKDVTPTLAWYDGTFTRMTVDDTYDTVPVDLGSPMGSIDDASAKLYPFKVMTGNQPADTTNMFLVVPHLFGTVSGDNPYWGTWDWALALAEGAAWAGQDFSGDWDFVETYMYMEINHEVAPKEQALSCDACHGDAPVYDFTQLGYDNANPMMSGVKHATE